MLFIKEIDPKIAVLMANSSICATLLSKHSSALSLPANAFFYGMTAFRGDSLIVVMLY